MADGNCNCENCRAGCECQEAFGQSVMRYNDQSSQQAIAGCQNYQIQQQANWRSLMESQAAESMARLQLLLKQLNL